MAHECLNCGQECYCDMDDCGGFDQPDHCPHLTRAGVCSAFPEDDEPGGDPRCKQCGGLGFFEEDHGMGAVERLTCPCSVRP